MKLRETRGLTMVAVTHQGDLVRRLGGALLYLVEGRVHAYERVGRDGLDGTADESLRAFLASAQPSSPA